MKYQHLLGLPDAPAAHKVVDSEHWERSDSAWLRCVWQNWCCYNGRWPQKDTIIFTNLPTPGAIQERHCHKECRDLTRQLPNGRMGGRHAQRVMQQCSTTDRAKWPLEFIVASIKACVDTVNGMLTAAAQPNPGSPKTLINGGLQLSCLCIASDSCCRVQ